MSKKITLILTIGGVFIIGITVAMLKNRFIKSVGDSDGWLGFFIALSVLLILAGVVGFKQLKKVF